MLIKKENQSRKGLCLSNSSEFYNMGKLQNFNFTSNNCARHEAAFLGHNSNFCRHCPMSGANIQI